jgi:hypothetical protein
MKDYTPSLSELEARLEKLERQNRRLKGLGLGFLLIVLSGLLLAQTSRKPAHAAPASDDRPVLKERSPMKNYTPSLSELETRLEKLQRQNRRLKGLGLVFLLIVLSGLLLARTLHKPAHTLVVHRLELRDEAGKLCGDWIVKNGATSLRLYDAAGKPRAALGVTGEGPSLWFYDAAGKYRAGLGMFGEGPSLWFYDAAGNARAGLEVDGEGPGLALLDDAGKPRARLTVDGEGAPGLWFYDAAGKLRVALAVTGGGPGLGLIDAAGKGGVGIDQNSLSVTDVQGFKSVVGVTGLETPATGENDTTGAAAVTLFGKDRKVIWQAP